MAQARTLAQRSFMRKIGLKTTKTTKSNANMLAIAGETSPTSSASSSGPSTNNILPMLNPIEVEDESMAEGSEDELATPTVTTTPTTTTTTTTDEELANKKRTVEQLFTRKPCDGLRPCDKSAPGSAWSSVRDLTKHARGIYSLFPYIQL